jgi:hypothetical protein
MTEFLDSLAEQDRLKPETQALRDAVADVLSMVDTMLGWLEASRESKAEVYKIGQNTTRLLMSVGDIVIGWLLTRQAAVALDAGVPDDFYAGKVAVARFFTTTVLPELAARRRVLEQTDNALMEIPDGAF